jgi:NitT/TauT family transport system substrate-binding protein
VDSLPFLVAEQRGYYEAEGVDVTLEMYNSGLDRDGALQGGQADGAIADIITTVLLNKSVPVDIVSIAAGVTPEEGRFALLAAPDSSIRTAEDLRGVPIAVSSNTIIEFTTDMMLRDAGLEPEDIEKTLVLDIPLRLQLLLFGEVEAANLPDPLATLAETKGARVVLDDTQGRNLSQSVMIFTDKATAEKGEAVRRLLQAYSRAVADIQADPEAFRPLLEEKLRLPPDLTEYTIGPFSPPKVPSREQLALVQEWMQEKGILEEPPPYEELVNGSFLPDG